MPHAQIKQRELPRTEVGNLLFVAPPPSPIRFFLFYYECRNFHNPQGLWVFGLLKPSRHDCMDAGGRATQEQLPMDDARELQGCIYAFSEARTPVDLSLHGTTKPPGAPPKTTKPVELRPNRLE
jgi:hypothetical protein